MSRRNSTSPKTAETCLRTWEVAAARDKRLAKAARADLDDHIERCDACARERESIVRLAGDLRAMPVEDADDLTLRRLRTRVLESADAKVLERRAVQRPIKSIFAAALLAAALVAIWFSVFRLTRVGPLLPTVAQNPAPIATTPPQRLPSTQVVATDEGNARFSSHDDAAGDVRRIDLASGTLGLRIDRPQHGQRVIVHVPDGEIEDTGTIFHVTVTDGRTERVRVDEGSVILRIAGAAPHTVHANETWSRSDEALPPTTPTIATAAPAPTPPPARAPSASAFQPKTSMADASDDDREEDRAYVEIVRLLREGRSSDAKSAARDYLRRFPHGFRRAEVDGVLTRP